MKQVILGVAVMALSLVYIWPLDAVSQTRRIREGIIEAIETNKSFGAYDVTIDARRGIVTLDGNVSSDADREFVERAAWEQDGVTSVINNLQVKEDLKPAYDPTLAQAVRNALAASPEIKTYSINIGTRGGVVTLSGEVGTLEEKRIIERVARSVPGVSELHNQLTLRPGGSDAEVAAKIREALASDPQARSAGVQVEVNNGVATVRGKTHNHRETDRILSIVLMIPGVKDIRSDIEEDA